MFDFMEMKKTLAGLLEKKIPLVGGPMFTKYFGKRKLVGPMTIIQVSITMVMIHIIQLQIGISLLW